MKHLKNKELLGIIFIYMFVTMFLSRSEAVLYTNVINPIFWVGILIYLLWDIKL